MNEISQKLVDMNTNMTKLRDYNLENAKEVENIKKQVSAFTIVICYLQVGNMNVQMLKDRERLNDNIEYAKSLANQMGSMMKHNDGIKNLCTTFNK